MSIRALVTDIEGTTTDIAFVHQRLFPLARAAMPRFVHAHANDPAHAASFAAVRTAVAGSARDAATVTLDEELAQLLAWMDADAKVTPLKAIQGAIWRDAYADGELLSHVFADVAPVLRRLVEEGVKIYVYSSGSIEAQRQLFQHTEAGDLTTYLSGYFDTTTGPKKETASYAQIAATIGLPAAEVLFVSDVIAELDAARTAGMQTLWMVRPGCAEVDAHDHARAASFEAIGVTKG
ncbi:2,3-diketo-5-methylthiopentyl-1-phosphate enolase-phosphatase [Minicystis rosea]|nr:2,3-diketo-5-methylthiopentyl-1-phosphate enolase-phosphatase [Minicystis rosea]